MGNIVTAFFPPGSNRATTAYRYQFDYGQILQFSGITLPSTYMVHFSNYVDNEATKMLGDEDGVEIPDAYLMTGLPVYAWVYLHTGEDDGETVYEVTIPVRKRSQPTDETPTPAQQTIIDQLVETVSDVEDRVEAVEEKTNGGHIVFTAANSISFSNDITLYTGRLSAATIYSVEQVGDSGMYKYELLLNASEGQMIYHATEKPLLVGDVYVNNAGISAPASMQVEGEAGAWNHIRVTFYYPSPSLTGTCTVDFIGFIRYHIGGE